MRFEFTLNINLGERITRALERIAMDMPALVKALSDAGDAVSDVGTQLTKALGEISDDITALQGQIAAGAQTTPEVDAALTAFQAKLASVKSVAQSLDDIVPDPAAPAPSPSPSPAPGDGTTPPDDGTTTP